LKHIVNKNIQRQSLFPEAGNIQLNATKHGTQSSGESVFIAVAFRQTER
jgi:hypothetical protein